MRILWVSDSPESPSGFGTVTRAVCRRLNERGHAVEILGWQTRGAQSRCDGIPVHPVRQGQFGSDVLLGYLYRFRPEFVVTLADVWWMSFLADPPIQQYLDLSGTRWVLYYPVDGVDAGGTLPSSWIRVLETADVPVAMSRFGVEASEAAGIASGYVPHGCDTGIFAPPLDKEAAKAVLGYDGRFVVLSDARNQPRKLLPRALDVFARFAAHKIDVALHLHCDPDDDAASTELYSYRLREDVEALGLVDKVGFTGNFRMRSFGGLSAERLARLYAAADAHLLCSWGEGFGLPTLQAASAGVVPIAAAHSASRELVEGHGFAVAPESFVRDEFGLERCLLNRDGAAAALDRLYRDPLELSDRSRRSREFALAYDWERVVDMWEAVLGEAPPRRKPTRARAFEWRTPDSRRQDSDVPDAIEQARRDVFARLPAGARVSVQMTERTYGEVAAEIRRDAFVRGEPLSVPVRLPPAFAGAPQARIGTLLVGPEDLPLAADLSRVFPGLTVSVPLESGDVSRARPLSLDELVPALPHYALVIDRARQTPRGTDVACAALGVPYLGPSPVWPDVDEPTPFLRARCLLTDQGASELRRRVAAERVDSLVGREAVERLRSLCLAAQPEPRAAAPPKAGADLGEIELFIVQSTPGGPDDTAGEISRLVTQFHGFVLMTTGRSLVVALPHGAKDRLEAAPEVGFVGGINLDEEADGARSLKKLFIENAVKQLAAAERG